MEVKKAVGRTVRIFRLKLGVSQEALSFEADVSRPYIGQIERGEKEASISVLIRICKALKIKPSEFMKKLESRI